MSFISDIGNAFSKAASTIGDIAKVAAPFVFPGPTLALTAFNLVSDAFGEGVKGAAKQMCQEMGMPKFLGDLIGKLVDKVLDDCRKPSNPDCDRHCGNNPETQQCKRDFIQDLIKSLVDRVKEELKSDECNGGGGGGGKKSWFVALASALGKVAGEKAKEMVNLSNKIVELNGAGEEKAQEAVQAQNELNGLSKEFQMFMEMINNLIKGLGDGQTTVLRK